MTPPPDVPLVMRARLGELGVCWMQLRCGCGRSCTIHLQLLAQRHGAGIQMGAILPRLKCKGCGEKPTEATLTERPDAGAYGGGGHGWTIPLIGGLPPSVTVPV